tara:strand:+ start:75 stop:323 length:249 start_codon:yes stop_codon:yes gene_type:complete
MQVLSLVIGILAAVMMLIGFIPCLGALNWLNIPFAVLGIIISSISLATAENRPKGGSIAGLVCSGMALIFGGIRLLLGGGVL